MRSDIEGHGLLSQKQYNLFVGWWFRVLLSVEKNPNRNRKGWYPPWLIATWWVMKRCWNHQSQSVTHHVSPCFQQVQHVSPCFNMFHQVSTCFQPMFRPLGFTMFRPWWKTFRSTFRWRRSKARETGRGRWRLHRLECSAGMLGDHHWIKVIFHGVHRIEWGTKWGYIF